MHSVLSHSLYFIHSSRNTNVTANGENAIPLLIFESAQKHTQEIGIISQSTAWQVTSHVQ